jgi:DNA segregation ATPase FtsK/SpoIIIE, S-DNA-T family
MASDVDELTIQRAVSNRNRRNSKQRKGSATPEPEERGQQSRQVIIISLLLFTVAVLVFLALISYSAKDEANAELNMRDIIAVLRGDDAMRAKIDTTYNWLGLLGAVVANSLYNFTFGYVSIVFPIMLGWWAKNLYTHFMIPRKTLERSGMIIVACAVVAAWFGSIQTIDWLPTLSREWSGAVGQFFAEVLSSLLGSVGAFLLTSVTLFITVAIVFDIDIQHTIERARLYYARFIDWVQTTYTKIKQYDKEPTSEIENDDSEKPKRSRKTKEPVQEDNEPARMVRRTLQQSGDGFVEVEPRTDPLPPKIVRIDDNMVDTSTGEILAKRVSTSQSANGKTVPNTNNQTNAETLSSGLTLKRAKNDSLNSESLTTPSTEKVTHDNLDESEYEEYDESDEEISTEDYEEVGEEFSEEDIADDDISEAPPLTLTIEETHHEEEVAELEQPDIYDEEINFTLPGMALLDDQADEDPVNDAELTMNARILQEKLETFKIKIQDVTIAPGPVITQYEFVPAAGVKISQIESLTDDISLALKARGIRIVAPVPGKGTVGVEIPNHKPSVVRFSSIIKSKAFNDNDKILPLALGKTIVGEVFCTDLVKMPHLLIAGSTGSGKSVGINNILMSLVYKIHPRDLKFVIIDPKKVEMTLYSRLKNHYMAVCPDIDEVICTTPQNAVALLKSVVMEMEERYDLLSSVGQRNIREYNQKILDGRLVSTNAKQLRPLPYIVVIIDELADLMITAKKDVEEPIVRLAQLARAVGIHLIVATQRPSVDVITGLIKANFPARIVYQVASKIDSRTVIDSSGAEQLLGNGDMLFTPGGAKPQRLQNSFISTEEVEAVTEFIGNQRGYSSPYMLPSILEKEGIKKEITGDFDPLFADAARTIVQFQQGSTSLLQRKLKIGYARAARIIDELESAGIVGSFDGSKARAVMIESEAELDLLLHQLGL